MSKFFMVVEESYQHHIEVDADTIEQAVAIAEKLVQEGATYRSNAHTDTMQWESDEEQQVRCSGHSCTYSKGLIDESKDYAKNVVPTVETSAEPLTAEWLADRTNVNVEWDGDTNKPEFA